MMTWIASFLFGLCFGSFANVCIYRLPSDRSLTFPGSYCPSCLRALYWYDNVPLAAFIWLRGRCRFCQAPISWRYPATELAMAFLFLVCYWRYSFNPLAVVWADFLSFELLTLSIIDAQHRIIPDELSVSLFVAGILFAWVNPFLPAQGRSGLFISVLAGVGSGAAMLILAWVGERIFKKEALGGGDIKLMAGLGSTLGWNGVIGALMLGSFLGGLWGLSLILMKGRRREEAIAFGPFLSFGAFVTYVLPLNWMQVLFP